MATQAEANEATPTPAPGQGGATSATDRARALAERTAAFVRRRRWIALAGLVVFGALVAIAITATTDMVPVARDMLPEDQKAAADALQAKGIPYELGAGGTLLVPMEQIHEARLELAVSAVPSGRMAGFELFDESEMGRSSFSQKVNFRRAMEGELARTVQTLDPVERARVHLVMPERRLFEKDRADPSASVIVTLRRGMTLSARQVSAVRQLVGGAVERLGAEQVAVVDQNGRVLARGDGDGMEADRAMERQLELERAMERRIVALLEPTVGMGRVRAKVSARLDFSHVHEQSESYDPDSQVAVSEHERIEKRVGESKPAKGPPGTASNLPTRQPRQEETVFTKPSSSEVSDSTKNYAIDKKVVRRDSPHPRVERLSVAVVLDAVRDASGTVKRARDAEELAGYRKLVARAVGLDEQRGDTVEVASLAFTDEYGLAPVEAADVPDEEKTGPTMRDWITWGLLGLGAVVMLVLLVLALRKGKPPVPADDEEGALTVDAMEREIRQLTAQAQVSALRDKAIRQAEGDILVTASVLRRWLDDKKG